MKYCVLFLSTILMQAGCKKSKSGNEGPAPCTVCLIEGIVINSETGQPQANKPIALLLDVSKGYATDDPFVMTNDSGYFKIAYRISDAKNGICFYPKKKKFDYDDDLCLIGQLEIGRRYQLGKIYTNAYFP